jgi:hypothetical protein
MLSAISCAFLGSSVARRFTGTYMVAIANVLRFIIAATRCSSAHCSLIHHLAHVASSLDHLVGEDVDLRRRAHRSSCD